MSKLCLTGFLACVISLTSVFTSRAEDAKPVLTIATGTISSVLDSIEGVAKQLGYADQVKMARVTIDGLQGIDKKKPIAVSFLSTGEGYAPVVLLPVTDVKKIVDTAGALLGQTELNVTIEEGDEPGQYFIETPAGAVVVTAKNGWAVLMMDAQSEYLPSDPAKIVATIEKDCLIGFDLNLGNTTQEELEAALLPIKMVASFNPDPQVKRSLDMMDTMVEFYFNNIVQVKESFRVDAKTGDITIDESIVFKSDSDVAKSMSTLKETKSNFGGFYQPKGSVFSFIAASQAQVDKAITDKIMKVITDIYDPMIDGFKEQLKENEDGSELYANPVIDVLYKQYIDLAKSGKFDLAATLNANLTFVGALSVPDGKAFDSLVDTLLKVAEENDPEKLKEVTVKRNFTTYKDFKLTSFSGKELNGDVPPILNGKETSIVIGIKKDAICAAFGIGSADDVTKTLKVSLDKSATPIAMPTTPFV
ncbi:MAG: hypothetical protein LBU65_10505, partial [Planctomycetaceae bacterium]|nr:hypothetical protein [Planctomycetaceae bacterium]